ncbi:uncharacterized protein LOC119683254 [Teleopsis dalmanni]|uniref:uncharacterized protein LOC119683254 n=1 Tax=Teleopsis dalmanni TaxID=139649 RepID=UPI0018CF4269|nr:uncharacterized protein LOC119683254 [Teleopsis dalmanni]
MDQGVNDWAERLFCSSDSADIGQTDPMTESCTIENEFIKNLWELANSEHDCVKWTDSGDSIIIDLLSLDQYLYAKNNDIKNSAQLLKRLCLSDFIIQENLNNETEVTVKHGYFKKDGLQLNLIEFFDIELCNNTSLEYTDLSQQCKLESKVPLKQEKVSVDIKANDYVGMDFGAPKAEFRFFSGKYKLNTNKTIDLLITGPQGNQQDVCELQKAVHAVMKSATGNNCPTQDHIVETKDTVEPKLVAFEENFGNPSDYTPNDKNLI